MKALFACAVVALVGFAETAKAAYSLNVNGSEYPLVALMENCSRADGGDQAKLKCFAALTKLLKDQSGEAQTGGETNVPVNQAFDNLKSVAEYQDGQSGLSITGDSCNIRIVYYGNYYHVSRRNISTIDLIAAEFDASAMNYQQTAPVQGATMSWSRGLLLAGETAVSKGGTALESAVNGFDPKGPSANLADYANYVVEQLPPAESQNFDFVLVHPNRAEASAEIWSAFKTFVSACQS